MEPVALFADELELSTPTADDIPAITAACQDPDIARYTTLPSPYSTEDAEQFVAVTAPASWEAGGGQWAIRRDGHLLGVIGLFDVSKRVAEIGYWMAPEARGQGVLTEAVGLVLDFGFGTGLRRIEWRAVVDNWGSWRPVWKHGFRREGIFRAVMADSRDVDAPYRDAWVGALLSTDPRTPATPWDGPEGTLPAVPDPARPMDLVRQFHNTYDVPVVTTGADVDVANLGMRMALIAEEFGELVGAIYGSAAEGVVLQGYGDAVAYDDDSRDTVAAADALADLVYVTYGMALETGIPLTEVLGEVQRSNLSKLDADGSVLRRADGKVLKGPNFRQPKIAAILEQYDLS